MSLPGAALRSANVRFAGCGPGSWSAAEMRREMGRCVDAVVNGGFGMVGGQKVRVEGLADVERVWGEEDGRRVVFRP